MTVTKTDVLDILRDPSIRHIRFFVGPINVNSDEYDKVSDYIEAGAITVTPVSGTTSKYRVQTDTLFTRTGDPSQINVRSNILHECTHIISDINKYKVGRLVDEVAAYLAQIAYLLILSPKEEEPPVGHPLYNMTLLTMQLVKKYDLGKPAGYGATINQSDISDLAHAIHPLPDYSDIGENEMLDADGVSLSDEEELAFHRFQVRRIIGRSMDDEIAKDIERRLYEKTRVSYLNNTTSDTELLALLQSYGHGGAQRQTAVGKLTRIFLTIDQTSAARLVQRLSTPSKGDTVADRFQSVLSHLDKSALLAALRITR
jgi:hypothetical protein